MRTLFSLVAFLLGSALTGKEVRLHVVDDEGKPLAGVDVLIAFTTAAPGKGTRNKGQTDRNGAFSGSGYGEGPVLVRASKGGYYGTDYSGLRILTDKNLDLRMVLPRIIRPVPLLARNLSLLTGASALRLLIQDEWLDYDLAMGDWVKPRGKGEVADIRFKFHNEFKGWRMSDREMAEKGIRPSSHGMSEEEIRDLYGKIDGEVEISFPDEQEGMIEVKDQFRPYSELTMPHEAPLDGYVSTRRYVTNTYTPRYFPEEKEMGFFLRTRVKRDKDGRIISANYAKVTGDFEFDARGVLGFAYYFNPVSNDRNLEFDPKKNLFPADFPGANVYEP